MRNYYNIILSITILSLMSVGWGQSENIDQMNNGLSTNRSVTLGNYDIEADTQISLNVEREYAEVIDTIDVSDLITLQGSTGGPTGVAWDGDNLWFNDWLGYYAGVPQILKIDSDGNLLQTIENISSANWGLAYDGENFWSVAWSNHTVYNIDQDGLILGEFETGWIEGITYDGEFLWLGGTANSDWDDVLYIEKRDVNGVLLEEHYTGIDAGIITGLVWVDGLLYASTQGYGIYIFDESINLIGSLDLFIPSIGGLTFDGQYLWLSSFLSGNEGSKLYQIDIEYDNGGGCMDSYACNYDPDATEDDGSCEYEVDCAGECGGGAEIDECGVCDGDGIDEGACDCDGNVEDCAGECGGSTEVDECGICDGSGPEYVCEDNTMVCDESDCPGYCAGPVCLELINIFSETGELDVHMTNQAGCSYCTDPLYDNQEGCEFYGDDGDGDASWEFNASIEEGDCDAMNGDYFNGNVGGFQFELYGIELIDATAPDGFTVSVSSTTVLAFSLTGATIPPGSGILTHIDFSGYSDGEICFGDDTGSSGNTAISDEYANYIAANWGGCVMPEDYSLAQISVNPESLSSDLFTGEMDSQILTISNNGGVELDWELQLQFGSRQYFDVSENNGSDREFNFTITWDDGTTAQYDLDLDAGYDGAYQVESATISFSDGSTVDAGPTNPCNRTHGSGEILWDGFMLTSNVWDADCNQFAFDVMSPSGDMNTFMENGGNMDFATGGYYGDWSGGSYSTASLNLSSWLLSDISSGSVPPGSSQDVQMTFDASGLFGGDYLANIFISSNAPVNSEVIVPASLTVTGIPIIDAQPNSIDFGTVFVDGTYTDLLNVINVGTDILTVSDIESNDDNFTIDNMSFTLDPGESYAVEVSFSPTEVNDYESSLSIFSDDPDNGEYLVSLLGIAILPPDIDVSPESLSASLYAGDADSSQLITISNTGSSDLDWSAVTVEDDRVIPFISMPDDSKREVTFNYGLENVPGMLLVRYNQQVTASAVNQVEEYLSISNRRHFEDLNMYFYTFDEDKDIVEVFDWVNAQDGVVYAEPNYRVEALYSIPNDEYFNNLWGMHNTGQTGGVDDADVDAPEAWDVEQGSSDIVVGVIDTGIDYNHPDLMDNMWTNPGEIQDNGIDDDGNGYIDDYYGYNFIYGTSDPWDDNGHGTHCAGTIGAVGDNGIGVAGVNWYTNVAALKWIDNFGGGLTFAAVEAVLYANMMNFDLTSNSWHIWDENSQALRDAIEISEPLFVNAAGNSWYDMDVMIDYPTSYDLDNMLTIAASDHNDNLVDEPGWWGSNYGLTTVDVAAPGLDIYSTLPNNSYGSYSGTSMACPHVAGIVALVLSRNSNLHWSVLKEIIMISSDPQPDLDGKCVTGARVNAYNALMEAGAPWLELAEDSGLISAGESIDIQVTFDAADMSGGDYLANIIINSNDPDEPQVSVAASLSVTGAPNIDLSDSSLDFGELFVGGADTLSLIISNTGSDLLNISNIDASGGEFSILSATEFSLEAGEESALEVTFSPSSAGYQEGVITISSNDADNPEVTVNLSGTGLVAPDISVNPDSLSADLNSGETQNQTFTIANDGGSDLEWEISIGGYGASFNGHNLDLTNSNQQYITSDLTTDHIIEQSVINPPESNGDRSGDLLNDAIFINSIPKYDDMTPMDIAWDGEYYYMTSGGNATDMYQLDVDFNVVQSQFVSVDSRGVVRNPANGELYMKGFFGGFYQLNTSPFDGSVVEIFNFGTNGQAQFTFSSDGQYIFTHNYGSINKYEFPSGVQVESFAISGFGVGIAHTGDYLIVGDGYDQLFAYDEQGNFVAAVNLNDDGCSGGGASGYGTPSYANGIAFTFNACYINWSAYIIDDGEGISGWLSVNSSSGSIPAGSSEDVQVTFDATDMEGGDYSADIVISSNDPDEGEVTVSASLHVTGAPGISVSPDSLSFGEIYVGNSSLDTVMVTNSGTDILEVYNASVSDSMHFSVSLSDSMVYSSSDGNTVVDGSQWTASDNRDIESFSLSPGESRYLLVTFSPSDVSYYDDQLIISSSAPSGDVVVSLSGSGLYAPELTVDPSEISASVAPGDSSSSTFTISNTGGDTLDWSINVVDFGRDGTSYTFSNCGQEGRFGPEQSQCDTAYTGTSLDGNVTLNGGIQEWVVPYSGNYTIEVWGAQGGPNHMDDQGGLGARTEGNFDLIVGEVLNIVVGQMGVISLTGNEYNGGSGGGGASFVWNEESELLNAAGGGGGSGLRNMGYPNYIGVDGTTTNDGTNARDSLDNGGYDGNDAPNGGAKGWNTVFNDPNGIVGMNTYGGDGGFGGGGGGGYGLAENVQHSSGGGGGYSGGGSCTENYYAGGGGGSYNSSENQDNASGINTGHGMAVITFSGPNWISASPSSGNIAAGSSSDVSVNFNASELEIGDYSANININSNGGNETVAVSLSVTDDNPPGQPDEFSFNQSASQAFYFVMSGTDMYGDQLEAGDWIGLFNGDVCVGAREWPGEAVDIPTMGDDGFEYSEGYLQVGDIPTFKIYDVSEDKIYSGFPSNNFAFADAQIYFIDELSGMLEYELILHDGANLASFYTLPDDNSIENVIGECPGNITGILAEGMASGCINDQWIGTLTEIDLLDGYWILASNPDTLIDYGTNYDPGRVYDLHYGANLISYSSLVSSDISSAIPDDVEDLFMGILSEGYAAMNDDSLGWVGSLTAFDADLGYWTIVSDDLSFSYETDNMAREDIRRYLETLPSESVFTVAQSPHQAFYFVDTITLDEGNIEDGDWLLSYNGYTVTGIRQWQGVKIDIPAMGLSDSKGTEGYLENGDIPTFKLFKQSSGELIPLAGDIPIWAENGMYTLTSLSEMQPIPNEFVLNSAYPNPFNPVTTLEFGIPIDGDVSIEIYNLQGRLIETLVSQNMKAGYHSVIWNANNHSSGMYFVNMVSGEYLKTQKLMLVK